MSRGAPVLYALTDRRATAGDLDAAVAHALQAGVRWLQVREKDLAASDLYALTRRLVGLAAVAGARVLVNDRADVAAAAGAHGVHLTGVSLPVTVVRRRFPDLLVGVSVHSLEAARAAAGDGADFVLFGPVFATPSKASYGPPQGVERLREVCVATPVPVVAIGGIGPPEVAACVGAGAAGVAAMRGLLGASDVAAAVLAFTAALARAGRSE